MLRVEVTARMIEFFVKLGHPLKLTYDSEANVDVTLYCKRDILYYSAEEKIYTQRK